MYEATQLAVLCSVEDSSKAECGLSDVPDVPILSLLDVDEGTWLVLSRGCPLLLRCPDECESWEECLRLRLNRLVSEGSLLCPEERLPLL